MNEPTEIHALNGGAKIQRRLCVFTSRSTLSLVDENLG